MPRATIWIKKEDYEKWLAIKDRPQWLHINLQNTTETDAKWVGPDSVRSYGFDLQPPDIEYDSPKEIFGPAIQLCDHDNELGK